jgi:hypothetical protein
VFGRDRALNEGMLRIKLPTASHFIRWREGYATVSLSKVRDHDEYIDANTHLAPVIRKQVRCDHGVTGATHDEELIATLCGLAEDRLNSLDNLDGRSVEVPNA